MRASLRPGRDRRRATTGPRTTDAARPGWGGRHPVSCWCASRRVRRWGSVAVAVAVATGGAGRLLLLLLHDERVGGEHHRRDRGGVAQRGAGDLDRVDDAGLDEVPYSPVAALRPMPGLEVAAPWRRRRSPAMPGVLGDPAQRLGRGLRTMSAPAASSPSRPRSSMTLTAWMRAEPPPATMPSSMAARVAEMASSMRCFFSLSSTSVWAPTLMTQTPPASLARRSWSFSRSQSESVRSISALIWLTRPVTSSWSPAPSMIVGGVLGDDDAAGLAQHVEVGLVELEADLLGDDLAAGEGRDVLEHRLAAVAEAGRLDRDDVERAADLVDDERRQRLAVDVLGDDRAAACRP